MPKQVEGQSLPLVPSEADLLLSRLKASGLRVPDPGFGKIGLNFKKEERASLNEILITLPKDGEKTWIGIGPGSNQPAKIWPKDRYKEVVSQLISKHDVWPVVFGGKEDKFLGDELLAGWKRGYNFAGLLPVRLAGLAFERCQIYLGNDTGTMHLAASVGIPCVAIFSSHNYPGKWYPYGSNHHVFYKHVDCEGCGLVECIEEKMKCILSIQPKEVLKACEQIMDSMVEPKNIL
ncbi:MAG TPA: glycosyltransferase family 9 protein [bacterium]